MSDSTVIVDPALVEVPFPVITGVRYFQVEDDAIDYTVVATDLEHAKQILLTAKQGFEGDTGEFVPCDDCRCRWTEISAERAARFRVHDDDRGGVHMLNTYPAGQWCGSEF